MSTTIANDILFKPSQKNPWEIYPYTSGIGGAGDLHYFNNPGSWNFFDGKIPESYVKLNIRNKLGELNPKQFPNMDTVGYAVKGLLSKLGIVQYYTAEDRGWEMSDYWATLEAIFIPKKDYESKILSKINTVAQTVLCEDPSENSRAMDPLPEVHPLKKGKNTSWENELECPITHQRMRDPVMGSDGHTYERSAIEDWLRRHPRSPLTGESMTIGDLRPNYTLRKIIEGLKQSHK